MSAKDPCKFTDKQIGGSPYHELREPALCNPHQFQYKRLLPDYNMNLDKYDY